MDSMRSGLLIWKIGAIIGVCLTMIGLSAGYVEAAFTFDFLDDHFDIFSIVW
jgi:hypothetical protein